MTVSGETYPLGGDLIVSVDSTPVMSLDRLRDVLADKKPGDSVALGIWRGDQYMVLNVKLGRQPTS